MGGGRYEKIPKGEGISYENDEEPEAASDAAAASDATDTCESEVCLLTPMTSWQP